MRAQTPPGCGFCAAAPPYWRSCARPGRQRDVPAGLWRCARLCRRSCAPGMVGVGPYGSGPVLCARPLCTQLRQNGRGAGADAVAMRVLCRCSAGLAELCAVGLAEMCAAGLAELRTRDSGGGTARVEPGALRPAPLRTTPPERPGVRARMPCGQGRGAAALPIGGVVHPSVGGVVHTGRVPRAKGARARGSAGLAELRSPACAGRRSATPARPAPPTTP
jgi:hypothetical protein